MAIRFVTAALVAILLLAQGSDAALTCATVVNNMTPCVGYLRSGTGKPPAACCAGLKRTVAAAGNTADKRTACNCLKNAARNVNPKPDLALALPRNCGVTLSFVLTPNVDCSKIRYTV